METETLLTTPVFLKLQAMPSRIGQSEADGAGGGMFSPHRVIGKARRANQAADYRGAYTPRSPPRIGEEQSWHR